MDVTSELASKLRYLKAGAYYSATSRGHDLGRWIATDVPEVEVNECKMCQAHAEVDARYDPLITGVLGQVTEKRCNGP